ncbi:hypothetical protein K474DRAFT_1663537 [Panus rudis PR-1116 ss-1]|nr:hypothetical protein K474DRAFT_1663537 [Panus rudis PR-1116 ss-1]
MLDSSCPLPTQPSFVLSPPLLLSSLLYSPLYHPILSYLILVVVVADPLGLR